MMMTDKEFDELVDYWQGSSLGFDKLAVEASVLRRVAHAAVEFMDESGHSASPECCKHGALSKALVDAKLWEYK